MAVRALIGALKNGAEVHEQVLADAELEAADLEDGLARVPWEKYFALVRAALRRTNDPAFGLHMTEQSIVGAYDALCHLTRSGCTLRDAIDMCIRYAGLVVDSDAPIALLEHGSTATIRLCIAFDDSPEGRFVAEQTVGGLCGLIPRFVGDHAIPRRVYFAHRAPSYRAEYTRLFAGRERFGHAFTGFDIDRAWLDCKQVHHFPELQDLLQTRVEALLARVERDATATARVQRWLGSNLQREKPSLIEIAHGLGMSTRSLRRKLREEGAHCSELIDNELAARARRMLADRHCSLQETAFALGFATHSAFTRAFKRWTGLSPTEFRAQHTFEVGQALHRS